MRWRDPYNDIVYTSSVKVFPGFYFINWLINTIAKRSGLRFYFKCVSKVKKKNFCILTVP